MEKKVTTLQLLSYKLGNGLLRLEYVLSFLFSYQLRKTLARANYDFNSKQEIEGILINDQNTGEATGVHKMRIGKVAAQKVGCEVIAVYNALLLLGQSTPFSKVALLFEQTKVLTKVPFVPVGTLGGNPFGLPKVLQTVGYAVKQMNQDAPLEDGVYLLSYWNYGGILKGLHTVAVSVKEGKITLYNYFDRPYTMDRQEWMHRFSRRLVVLCLVREENQR